MEDILAHDRLLFTLPCCERKAPLLQVFDMDVDGLPLVGTFSLEAGLHRNGPLIISCFQPLTGLDASELKNYTR